MSCWQINDILPKSKQNKIVLLASPGESEDELEYVRLRGQLFSQTFSFLHKLDPFYSDHINTNTNYNSSTDCLLKLGNTTFKSIMILS